MIHDDSWMMAPLLYPPTGVWQTPPYTRWLAHPHVSQEEVTFFSCCLSNIVVRLSLDANISNLTLTIKHVRDKSPSTPSHTHAVIRISPEAVIGVPLRSTQHICFFMNSKWKPRGTLNSCMLRFMWRTGRMPRGVCRTPRWVPNFFLVLNRL